MLDECFYGLAGEGAFVVQTGGEKRPLTVSPTADLQASLLCTGYPHDRRLTGITNLPQTSAFLHAAQGIRRLGSAALELAYVAAGRLDGFWELRLSSWDYAAGVLLVQEAGGRVTQTDATPYALAPELPLVASNGHIHQQMLAILAQAEQ
jgi:myo-inositol-1(or 4)-monophosphatase